MTPAQRLELLDSPLWIYTSAGLSAAAAHLFVIHHYHGQPDREKVFRTNVANNIVYQSIESLIDYAVVGTYETINGEIQKFGSLGFEIPGMDELKGHRHYASHPGTIDWRKDMKAFIEKELHHRDIKAVRLFQARQAVIDGLAKLDPHKSRPENGAVATAGIVEMAKLCLSQALQPGVSLPPDFDKAIITFFGDFNKQVAEMAAKNDATIRPRKEGEPTS